MNDVVMPPEVLQPERLLVRGQNFVSIRVGDRQVLVKVADSVTPPIHDLERDARSLPNWNWTYLLLTTGARHNSADVELGD